MKYYRASRRVFLYAAICAVVGMYVLDLPWTEEDKKAVADASALEERAQAPKRAAEPMADASEDTEEDDVELPEEMPEDAIFIPLGLAHQLPQTFYKGTDPEWQSFIEFSKDKKRNLMVRSMLLSSTGGENIAD